MALPLFNAEVALNQSNALYGPTRMANEGAKGRAIVPAQISCWYTGQTQCYYPTHTWYCQVACGPYPSGNYQVFWIACGSC
jgi:hypothetical protein